MLMFAGNKLLEFTRLGKGQYMINMALENVLLHGRVLREFFYIERRKGCDDAKPDDFVKDSKRWKQERPPETHWIEKIGNRASKEVAHLTYKRYYGTPEEKNWNYGAILRDLLKVVKVFLDNVHEKYWSPRLSQIQQMIKDVFQQEKEKLNFYNKPS